MDANRHRETNTHSLSALEQDPDPDSPEFIDACLELIKRSTARRLPIAAELPGGAAAEPRPDDTGSRDEIESLSQQLSEMMSERDADVAALREARRREGQVRTELETLQTEISNVRTHYNDAIAALEAASQRASQARAEFANAMTVISDRDVTINQLRQIITDRNREIDELQVRLLQSEEARVTDVAAILDSLDKYRA